LSLEALRGNWAVFGPIEVAEAPRRGGAWPALPADDAQSARPPYADTGLRMENRPLPTGVIAGMPTDVYERTAAATDGDAGGVTGDKRTGGFLCYPLSSVYSVFSELTHANRP